MSKRTCFVIMPFSKTKSTSTKNWTLIYDKIIRPAIDDSGLEFVCKRSKATRGNIVKEIINDLHESDLVIADLTDHNANVCYELGIRHGLKIGTILLAQKREFLGIFDLHSYGSHVYKWKFQKDRNTTISKIRELLIDFIQNPDKIDSPVQDYLKKKPSYTGAPSSKIKDILEFNAQGLPQIVLDKKHLSGKLAVGLILLGNSTNGLTMNELVKQVSRNWKRVKSANLSPIISQQMSGWVIKDGTSGNYIYRLSTKGRNNLMKMVDLLKK